MRRSGLRALAIALSCAPAFAACNAAPPRPAPSPSPSGDPFVRAFRELRPSVVLFTMKIPSEDPKTRGRFDDAYGSGIVVESGRWGSRVLTVEHVIHGARDLRASVDGRRAVRARVVARDEKADLAIVTIPTPALPVATLGTARGLEPGTAIGVAGYPIPDAFQDEGLGVATSVYAGRLSSVRNDSLELDLPVIPGESGGPVFVADSGVVVALAESRFDEEKAIGFGIPIDDAEHFLAQHPRPSLRQAASVRR